MIMNSYLLELLAKERVETLRREAEVARRSNFSRSAVTKSAGRFLGLRFSFNRARQATPFVDCR